MTDTWTSRIRRLPTVSLETILDKIDDDDFRPLIRKELEKRHLVGDAPPTAHPPSDRPLTDSQERALIALAEATHPHAPRWVSARRGVGETNHFTIPTWRALADRGLVLLDTWSLVEVKITEGGLAMWRSMGD